jgi:excisionase family DNA binding protein
MGQILTLNQVADYLKVPKSTIYRLVTSNQLPAFKVGREWRFDSDSLERWRQDQRPPVVKKILTLSQVADYLKVHKNTIYRLVMRRQLPAFKVGHDWRFDSNSLDRWLQGQQQSVKTGVNPSGRARQGN